MTWQQINGKNFRKKDEQLLKKAVNRYNSKLKRLEKKYSTENILLPDKLYIKQAKEQIQTRSDLNNFYKLVDKFMQRSSSEVTSMQGVKTIKYTKDMLQSQIRKSRKKLNNEIRKLEQEQDDIKEKKSKKTNDALENMYKFTTDELSKLKDNRDSLNINRLKEVRPENVKKSLENLIARANKYASDTYILKKKKIYKENYLKTMKMAFQYADKYNDLKNKLEQVSDEDFYKLIAFDDIVSDIKFYY